MTAFPQPCSPAGALKRLLRCAAGASAVEFALLAPLLVAGALSTADAGRAVHERMMIGQVLRAGAQIAMSGGGEDQIRKGLEAVANENFTITWDRDPDSSVLRMELELYCMCPDSLDGTGCATTCASGAGPVEVVRLTARKTFQGVMLPEFPISGSMEVVAG